MIAVEVAGGPVGGSLGERSRDMRRGLVGWGIAAGVILAAVPFLTLPEVLGAFVVLGFSDGAVFALLYLLPTYLPEVSGNRVALGLALVNFVQILIGSAITVGFAFVAVSSGYVIAWIFAGAASVLFLPAFALSRVAGSGSARPRPLP